MKKILKLNIIILLIISFGLLILQKNFFSDKKTVNAVTYGWGSSGETVRKIQTKLKQWGYMEGSADGKFGYSTYTAVIKFQKKNGISPTGKVGSQTLRALGISTNTASSSNNSNVYLLARAITGESRGEPYIGQVAVGAVILNRTRNPKFPSTVPGVIYQPGAFTAVQDGQITLEPTDSCLRAAKDALNGWDPTHGCIYYYNPATATSKWIWSRTVMLVIGKHRFCK